MGKDARRTYTQEQRAEALRLYGELGPAETGRQLGIPSNTIRQWARRAGVTGPRAKHVQAATEAAVASIAERRAQLADDLMGDVECLRMQLWEPCTAHHFSSDGEMHRGELAEPTFGDKVKILTSIGIAVDKIQLLTGAATSRTENIQRDQIDAELEQLLSEEAAKRNGDGSRNGTH